MMAKPDLDGGDVGEVGVISRERGEGGRDLEVEGDRFTTMRGDVDGVRDERGGGSTIRNGDVVRRCSPSS